MDTGAADIDKNILLKALPAPAPSSPNHVPVSTTIISTHPASNPIPSLSAPLLLRLLLLLLLLLFYRSGNRKTYNQHPLHNPTNNPHQPLHLLPPPLLHPLQPRPYQLQLLYTLLHNSLLLILLIPHKLHLTLRNRRSGPFPNAHQVRRKIRQVVVFIRLVGPRGYEGAETVGSVVLKRGGLGEVEGGLSTCETGRLVGHEA